MACAVPDKDDYLCSEDMLQISRTANDSDSVSSCSTSSRLEEICGIDSRNSDEGNDELPPKVGDVSCLADSASESQEYARVCHVKDLDYDPQKHTDPPTEKIKELSIKVAILSEQKEVLQEQLDKSNLTMLQQSQIENDQLKDKLTSVQDEMGTRIKVLESQLETSGIENDKMKDELASVDATSTLVKDLESQLQKSGVENNQIKSELASMNIRVKDLESQKTALDDEVKQLSEKNRTLYTTVYETGFKHHTDVTNKQKEKDELQIKLTSKEAERCQLQVWLDEAYEKIRILENQNQSSVNEAERQQNPGEASEMAAAVECEGAAKIEIRKDSVDIYNPSKIKVGLNNL